MKKRMTVSIILALSFILGLAQYKVDSCQHGKNQVDEQGRKQGCWAKYYQNGNPAYKAYFVDGRPVGKVIRFYEKKGTKKVEMYYGQNPDRVKAIHYFKNTNIAAEGYYKHKKRDSVWKFYDRKEQGQLVEKLHYEEGKKEGVSKTFYDDGEPSEILHWEDGVRDGPWKQFFANGRVKLETTYDEGSINGDFHAYHFNGSIHIDGKYKNDLKHGPWSFYDKKGNEKYTIHYKYGEPQNEELLEEKEAEFFKKVKENKGKYDNPTINDMNSSPGRR